MKNARLQSLLSAARSKSLSFTQLFAMTVVAQLVLAQSVVAQSTVDLAIEFDRSKQCRITSDYAHGGDVVVLKSGESTKTQKLPLQVRAKMEYLQRYTGNAKENQAIRFYEIARSNIQVDDGTTISELSDNNHYIVTRIAPASDRRMQLASLGDALRQSELDMLRNPGDPLTLPALFNKKGVEEGAKWSAPADALTDFLAVDRIINS